MIVKERKLLLATIMSPHPDWGRHIVFGSVVVCVVCVMVVFVVCVIPCEHDNF